MKPLIIDTDIGEDIDDTLALAYAIKSKFDIKLISTVHGDTEKRAKIAKKVTNLLGVEIPVVYGERNPIKQKHIFSLGDGGKGFIDNGQKFDISGNGVERIAETIYENPGISVACIGPLTNLARVFERHKDLAAKVDEMYFMGNAIVARDNYYINFRAHNFKVDPEAVDIIFAAPVRKTIITTEVSKMNYLTRNELSNLVDGELGRYITEAGIFGLDRVGYENAHLYDPLALAHHSEKGLTERVRFGDIEITTGMKVDFKKQFIDILGGKDENK